MQSTVQISSYMVPTSRTKPHHSQTAFDSNVSLMVKSLGPMAHVNAHYDKSRLQPPSSTAGSPAQNEHRSGDSAMSEGVNNGRWLSSKSGQDRREQVCLSTATVTKRGVISLKPQTAGTNGKKESYEPMWRSKSSHSMVTSVGKRKLGWTGTFPPKPADSGLGSVTVADLHGAIESTYPATAGVEFIRASAYVKQNINRLARHYEASKVQPASSEKGRDASINIDVAGRRTSPDNMLGRRSPDTHRSPKADEGQISKTPKADEGQILNTPERALAEEPAPMVLRSLVQPVPSVVLPRETRLKDSLHLPHSAEHEVTLPEDSIPERAYSSSGDSDLIDFQAS